MLEWKTPEISDKEWVDKLLAESDFRACEYSFGNNFIWREVSHIQIAEEYGCYLVKAGKRSPSYLYPAGSGDVKAVLLALESDAHEAGNSFAMHGILEESKALMETLFPGKYQFNEDRDSFDYIYRATDLIALKGKKYHSKRNFVNRFKQGDWRFEPITPENITECLRMNDEWCAQNDCAQNRSKFKEFCAVSQAFQYFDALGFIGGLLRLDGRVVAYTMGERLNSDTMDVHIEKAFSDVAGAYPTINQEFAAYAGSDYTYINREDDVGSEGLRKAKLSYQPEILLTKYTAVLDD